MLRSECLKSVVDLFTNVPCFITVGRVWPEWEALRPSDGNFQVKTLGSGSSHGLGLAMALPHRKIAVLDGDGAVTMNVNGLLTVGRLRPKNLIHLVFDNKMYESSGSRPTATTYHADLVGFAAAAGIKSAIRVATVADFRSAVKNAFQTDGPHFIVAAVKSAGKATSPAYSRMDETEGKFRFIRFLETVEGCPIYQDAIDVKLSID